MISRKMTLKRILTGGALIGLSLVLVSVKLSAKNPTPAQDERKVWKAPAEADSLVNPFADDDKAAKQGETIFQSLCAICHGPAGKGDGVAGMALNPRPANLTSEKVQSQSDGAIFWKITNGNAPMPTYRETHSDSQRWQLVKYIRTLKAKKK